ncbi:hypothetical protein K440DRAFT_664079 [Wilcoxina mikolae CBS 423.85]|nr:hypothetical protein K440DRAFT_664079 [Wilcoxina mikolae CBS 423.85]
MSLVADPDPLNIALTEDLSHLPVVKNAIITTLWGENISDEQYAYNEPRYIAYLKYYENECRHSARTVPFTTHRETVDAIMAISGARQQPFGDLQNILAEKKRWPTFATSPPEWQTRGITLCLRLLLMINIRDRRDGGIVAGARDIEWSDNFSVVSFVQSSLPDGRVTFSTDDKCLDDGFNVLSLERFANVHLVFTDNLADHLVFHRETRRLHIFRCGYFLTLHLSPSDRTTLCSNIFDMDFLHETRQTLDLLFPRHSGRCTEYLRKLQERKQLDLEFGRIPIGTPSKRIEQPFTLSDFQFYGKRLAILIDAFDSAKPTSLSQLWYDRRNKQTWYTMWIAVTVFFLTLLFGLISSVTGIMQVWAAYNPKSISN